MKRNTLLLLAICFTLISKANDTISSPTSNEGFAFGFHLNQFKDDFGLGINLTSPTIAKAFAIRLRGNFMYFEHPEFNRPNGTETQTWTPYSNIMLGLAGFSGVVANHFKLYGEGGLVAILPASEFSDESQVLGGYGLFGFELFSSNTTSYFFEAGGIGTGANAEKIPSEPIYSNGFLMTVGFRYTLK